MPSRGCSFRFKSAILNSMLLLQMFPAVLALVAIYAIFDAHRHRTCRGWASKPTPA